MVDNSQGHAAYASDALLATKMNLNPGGAVPKLQDGWFMHNGCRISQPMVFPMDHPTNPDQPKGIKQVLTEQGPWRRGLLLDCKKPKICSVDSIDCCAQRLLSQQPNFLEQKSSVQEVIEAAGHLCIFLPKFHCKLNLLSSSRVQSRNTCGSIGIIHLKHSRQTFQKLLDQFNSAPYGSGNTR